MQQHNILSVNDILRQGLDDYTKRRRLNAQQWKTVNAVAACRTHRLGGRRYRCDSCDKDITLYNSCRNRHCPQCQGAATAEWTQKTMEELLPVGYFHVVFTLPNQLNAIALQNKKAFYDIMFTAMAKTLNTCARDPKYGGGRIGFLAVLHTWGQTLIDHPHIHCMVPAGFLSGNGKRWKHCRKKFLFPVRVLSRLFRGVFLSLLKEAVKSGGITFHGSLEGYAEKNTFSKLLDELYGKEWVVYSKAPFAEPQKLVKYLGRYTHRIGIANSRIEAIEKETVTFRYKDYARGCIKKHLRIEKNEFVRRYLLHVLPQSFVRIRRYGLLCNRMRKNLRNQCVRNIGRAKIKYRTAVAAMKTTADSLSLFCPQCGSPDMRYRIAVPATMSENAFFSSA
jgi:hypothetical protein